MTRKKYVLFRWRSLTNIYKPGATLIQASIYLCMSQRSKPYHETVPLHCKENPIYVFPEKKILSLSPNFHIYKKE
jgi:hypothetical protein